MRKLATAAAVSLALASNGAFGLGLGDIEMQSALNQPMSAEIKLTSVQPGELEGMIVQLASQDAFTRAGIERSSVLLDLKFSVDQSSGSPVIKVESTRPVVEPFLNFLLEVDWPQGRMVREYTVLLDPPVFMTPSASERNSAADQPAVVQSGDAALVVPTPIDRGTAALDEGLDVDLGELEDAPGEAVLSLNEATSDISLGDDGELVTLDELSDDSLLSGGSAVADSDGNVVSLTDLGAPNTDAIAQREADEIQAFNIADIQVELVGDATEMTDDVVFGADGQPVVDALGDDGSTIVSLDGIEEPAQTATTAGSGNNNDEVVVDNGDTLFEIARNNTSAGVSVQQMMMALLAANESAFINNNINLVRAGAILRVPDSEDAARLTQAEALAAIGDQNQLWQDYRDSLRGTAETQVAQNMTPEANAEATSEASDGASESIESASLESDSAADGLSDEARAILDNARQEILDSEELRIVADNSPSSTSASATADETTDSDAAARIGEVNRKLQLAREELSSTRLRATDLSDQASELEDTTTNLDAMVSLRQNEVARLEAQLAEARTAAEAAAESSVDAATDAGANIAATAQEGIEESADAVTDAAQEGLEDAAGTAGTTAEEALAEAEAASDAVVDSGANALTEAGESLGEVELMSPDSTDEAGDAAAEALAAADSAATGAVEGSRTWYQDFLDDPKRMAIAGIGGLGLLGVLGTLLFRRKRRDDSDESMLDAIDEAEFSDGAPAAPDTQAVSSGSRLDDSAAFAAAGLTGAAASSLDDRADAAVDQSDNTFAGSTEEAHDKTIALGTSSADSMSGFATEDGEDGLDKDDTISEVDVYLAYGLHGQAEELLTKAIERRPDNVEYASKLLQTYHAQGNGEAFHYAATDFNQRFGGNDNPEWPAIAAMGSELKPNDPLYAMATESISRLPSGEDGVENLSDDDFFSPESSDGEASISRDFGASGPAVDLDDETGLMDGSLDPAFAFDESDLEATGDFSAAAEELAAENEDGSIDFPGFEEVGTAANETLQDELTANSEATMSLDELDGLTDSIDDLTLDLDQLSGDLELDSVELLNSDLSDLELESAELLNSDLSDLELESAELLNSDLSDLDIPDLTAENELLLDSTGSLGEGTDEMETMMDMAKAYIDIGDKDSASNALGEIVKSGSPEQVTEAETLLRNIS